MNTLLSIRSNVVYGKKTKEKPEDADEFIKLTEIIFLVDRPKYQQTNGGEIIRERAVEELRFTVSEKAYDVMLAHLVSIQKLDGSEE